MSYIQQISPIDIHWSQSFPLLVTPRKDEWLAGLLLRCDEVNCWESGGTLTSIFQLGKRINRKKDANLVIPTLRMLDQFAECLALPMEYLLTTTFYTEISRCYGTFYPHVSQLNRSLSFQVCPGCVASSRLLTRSLVLPYLHFCPYHHIALVNRCQCGSRLRLFSAYSSPFLCSVCNADWAALPSLVAHPDQMVQEQQIWSLFRFFLDQGTPQILANTIQYIRRKMKKEKIIQTTLLDGTTMRAEHYELRRLSLSYLVNILVSLEIPFSAITG